MSFLREALDKIDCPMKLSLIDFEAFSLRHHFSRKLLGTLLMAGIIYPGQSIAGGAGEMNCSTTDADNVLHKETWLMNALRASTRLSAGGIKFLNIVTTNAKPIRNKKMFEWLASLLF